MYRSTQPRLRGASHRLGHCKWPMRLDICMPSDSAGALAHSSLAPVLREESGQAGPVPVSLARMCGSHEFCRFRSRCSRRGVHRLLFVRLLVQKVERLELLSAWRGGRAVGESALLAALPVDGVPVP